MHQRLKERRGRCVVHFIGGKGVRVAPGREDTRDSVGAMPDPSLVRGRRRPCHMGSVHQRDREGREAGCGRWRSRAAGLSRPKGERTGLLAKNSD